MKRKLFSLLFALVMVVTLAVPAAADLVWWPEDDFYNTHASECTYEDRGYEVAGYGGSANLWSAPNGVVLKELPNGERGWVYYLWKSNGVEWAYLNTWEDAGWIPMDDLTFIYDSEQFRIDHGGDIVTGDPVPVDFHTAVCYAYPRGPVSSSLLEEDADYESLSRIFTVIYTDEAGLRWGHVGYYLWNRDEWVCLDDPMNDHLDTGIVEPAPSASQLRGSATVTSGILQKFTWVVAVTLVVSLTFTTGLLIYKLRPKKK